MPHSGGSSEAVRQAIRQAVEARLPDEETDEHLAVFNALVSANASGKELMQVPTDAVCCRIK